MKILKSKNITAFNQSETLKLNKKVTCNKERIGGKTIVKDIAENSFIILISLIPMIIAPAYNGMKGIGKWKSGFLFNPDALFLTLPFLIHCWLSFMEAKQTKYRMVVAYGYTLLLLVIVSVFFFLRVSSFELDLLKYKFVPFLIWLLVFCSYCFSVMTSIVALTYR